MNDEIIVFDNIIDIEYQEKIKNILLGDENYKNYEFPWYYTHDVTRSNSENSQRRPALTHGYVKYYGEVISEFHDIFTKLIQNCCFKLNKRSVNVIQGRSFLQLPLSTQKKNIDTPHIDTNEKHFVMLYYVLDSDGDTIIYNEKQYGLEKYTEKHRVSPKQGRCVIFDGTQMHTAEQPINSNIRCVVNYNLN